MVGINLMKIDSFKFGEIIIEGKKFTNDVIIFPTSVQSNWWREEGHCLCIDDLKTVLPEKPEVLLIGTGDYGAMKIPEPLVERLYSLGMDLIINITKKTCKIHNSMIGDQRKIITALHLTC